MQRYFTFFKRLDGNKQEIKLIKSFRNVSLLPFTTELFLQSLIVFTGTSGPSFLSRYCTLYSVVGSGENTDVFCWKTGSGNRSIFRQNHKKGRK